MATGQKAYLQDKNGQNLLVATDWSMIQNKPNNLATTDQLPTLTHGWTRDGITYSNGGYDYDHVNNGWNCAYRVADLGAFKIVELRIMFAVDHDVTSQIKVVSLPKICQPDTNEQSWYPTQVPNVYVFQNQTDINVYAQNGGKLPANQLVSFHNMYFTTL